MNKKFIFNWKNYIDRYPDLKKAGIKTFEKAYRHYLCYGKKENRTDYNRYFLKINRIPQTELVFKIQKEIVLPPIVDLRSKFPACYNQGNLGSCTSNAIVGAYQYLTPSFMGSRLFQYYNERVIEHSINIDSGATVSDSIKAVVNYGMCAEKNWPYNIKKFAVKPVPTCYKLALKHKALKVLNVEQTLTAMQAELTAGFPFVLGFVVYSSFESQQANSTGVIPMPGPNDFILGGHCVVVCGYNETHWICRNSWGTSWGANGYFYIPLAYFLDHNLCSDIWTILSDTN